MTRAKSGIVNKKRHKKILKMAKGYRGRANNCYRVAIEKVEKALAYSYRDRKVKKRDFRSLWIQRINAAARMNGISYSKLVCGLNKAQIAIDRKILSELATKDFASFTQITEKAKQFLA